MADRDQSIFKTLRLAHELAHELMDRLDDRAAAAGPDSGRAIRAPRRVPDLTVALKQPGGTRIEYHVLTRNISTQGIAFIHGGYVHAGSRFEADLPTKDGAVKPVRGTVVWCRHITGMVHEVAVRFEASIYLPDFVHLTPEQEQCCAQEFGLHRVNESGAGRSQTLYSRAVVMDASASQRAVAAMWLRKLGLEVAEAADPTQLVQHIHQHGVDVMLTDLPPDERQRLRLFPQLRQIGYYGAIIATSVETDPDFQRAILEAGCNAFVPKPITGRSLHDAINRLSPTYGDVNQPTGMIYSPLERDADMRPLIVQFVEMMPTHVDKLVAAAEANDLDKIKTMCQMLKGEGGAHGFWPITHLAGDLLETLKAEDALEAVRRRLTRLIASMRRVAVRSPQQGRATR